MPWLVPAILMLVLNCILTYFDVNLAAKVLGVFLVTEIVMLSLGALSVLFKGGGPDGFAVAETLNPVGAFTPAAGVAGASAGHRVVLRVLVVGRVRVDGDVRRGVQGSQARSSRAPP